MLVRLLLTPPASAGAALDPPLTLAIFERTHAKPPFSNRLLHHKS